jgi:hypothetical protein
MAEELVLIPKVKYQTMIKQLEERYKETTQTGGEAVNADKKIEDGQPDSSPVQSSEMAQPPNYDQSNGVTQTPNSVQSSEVTQPPKMYVKRPLVDMDFIKRSHKKAKKSRWINYRV